MNLVKGEEMTKWLEEEIRNCSLQAKIISDEICDHMHWLGLVDQEKSEPIRTYKEY